MLMFAVARRHDGDELSNKRAVSLFDRIAHDYDRSQYRAGRRTFVNSRHDQIVRVLSAMSLPDTASVLEAGCGPGNLVPEFASRYRRVCALDASGRMLDIARARAADFRNVTYHVGDLEALPFADASFDLVCSAGVIEYLPSIERALQEMHRVLRPSGLLILPTTNPSAPANWLLPAFELCVRRPCPIWRHRIPEIKRRLRSAGLLLERERHFYLTLPRPLNRLLPTVARNVESFLDRYMDTSLRHLAEGYIAVARKLARSHERA